MFQIKNNWFRKNELRTYKYLIKQFFCDHIFAQSNSFFRSDPRRKIGVYGKEFTCRRCGRKIDIPLMYSFEKELDPVLAERLGFH